MTLPDHIANKWWSWFSNPCFPFFIFSIIPWPLYSILAKMPRSNTTISKMLFFWHSRYELLIPGTNTTQISWEISGLKHNNSQLHLIYHHLMHVLFVKTRFSLGLQYMLSLGSCFPGLHKEVGLRTLSGSLICSHLLLVAPIWPLGFTCHLHAHMSQLYNSSSNHSLVYPSVKSTLLLWSRIGISMLACPKVCSWFCPSQICFSHNLSHFRKWQLQFSVASLETFWVTVDSPTTFIQSMSKSQ